MRPGVAVIPIVSILFMMEANSNFTSKPYTTHMGSSVSRPVSRTHKQTILEQVHQVIRSMLHTAEIDMANTVETSDTDQFVTNTAWVLYSRYHTVPKASSSAAIFARDMLFKIPFLAAWNK